MKNNSYIKIEDFLNGNFSEAEQLAFEKELNENSDLREQLALSKLANSLVTERRLLDVKELAAQAHAKSGNGFWKNTLLFSSLAIVTGASIYFFQNKEENKTVVTEVRRIEIKEIETQIVEKPENKIIEQTEKQDFVAEKKSVQVDTKLAIEVRPKAETNYQTVELVKHLSEKQDTKTQENTFFVKEEKLAPCANVKIGANVFANAACENEANGSIVVSSFGGGKAPYSTKIFDKNKQEFTLSGLSSGVYDLVVSDANDCASRIENIVVKAKVCESKYEYNPFIG